MDYQENLVPKKAARRKKYVSKDAENYDNFLNEQVQVSTKTQKNVDESEIYDKEARSVSKLIEHYIKRDERFKCISAVDIFNNNENAPWNKHYISCDASVRDFIDDISHLKLSYAQPKEIIVDNVMSRFNFFY